MPKTNDLFEILATIIYHKNYCGVGTNKKADFHNKKNIYKWLVSKEINVTLLINQDYVEHLSTEWDALEKQAAEACREVK